MATPASNDAAVPVDYETERRFQALIENIADAITLVDANGIVQYASSAVTRILGYPIDKFVGRDLFGFIHPGDLAYAHRLFSQALEQPGVGLSAQVRMQHRDGSSRWVDGVINNLLHEPGVKAIVANYRDITERRRKEEQRREAELKYRTLIEQIPAGTFIDIFDDSSPLLFRPLYASPQFEAMLGYTLEEMQADPELWRKLLHPEDRERILAELKRHYVTGEPFAQDYRLITRDGRVLWVSDAARVIRDSAGRPKFSQGILLDITERKQAEAALTESQRRLQALFDNALDAILLIDDSARYVGANPGACALTGYRREELLQLTVGDITPAPNREQSQELWRAFIAAGQQSGEYTLRRKDGTTVEVEYRAVANIVPGLNLAVLRDITERKREEANLAEHAARLRALSRRLVEAQEVERRHLARELHDQVGQNLTALNINLSILRSQLSSGPAATSVSRLDDSLRLVDETVARIRDVMAELRPAVLDDYGLLAALRWYAGRFSERTGIVTQVHGADLMPYLPAAVETALFRIAQEALTNVTKHAQAKLVTIALETPDRATRLIIADDGFGFTPTEPRQAGEHRSLGLDSMRERAEAVGGRLAVESAPGKGTRVIVEVPR